jgi:hypothetical protein
MSGTHYIPQSEIELMLRPHLALNISVNFPLIGRSTFLSNSTILQMQGLPSRNGTDILRIYTLLNREYILMKTNSVVLVSKRTIPTELWSNESPVISVRYPWSKDEAKDATAHYHGPLTCLARIRQQRGSSTIHRSTKFKTQF